MEALKVADADHVVRGAVGAVFQALIDAEATARIGAEAHQRTPERVAQRNGYRDRLLTSAAGDLELRIPMLRTGSLFPCLLERRRRIDQALFAVVVEAYVTGTSTRKVDDLVVAMGVETGISKSQVSRICAELDTEVAAFAGRSLADSGPQLHVLAARLVFLAVGIASVGIASILREAMPGSRRTRPFHVPGSAAHFG